MSQPAIGADHPVGLIVTDDLVRSRLTVFFRWPLAIPHPVLARAVGHPRFRRGVLRLDDRALHGAGAGRHAHVHRELPQLHDARVRLSTADREPVPAVQWSRVTPSTSRSPGREPQSRLTVFFRLFLAIPALFLTSVFRSVNGIIAFLGWFYALFTGRMSLGMRDLSAWLLRYEVQTYAYILLLQVATRASRELPRFSAPRL